jgi:succinoglycan biosynthesis protein ExoM
MRKNSDMSKVLVGISTYKRPKMLERLLQAVDKFKTDADVRLLIAENDTDGRAGISVVNTLVSSGYRFPLEAIVVEKRGLTYSRNAILEFGFSDPKIDFIAMMDDDQWPESNWLDALLKVQRDTAADIVGAAVWPEFEMPPPKWAVQSKAYTLDTTTTGPVDMLTGSGGILVSRNVVNLLTPPWYDHEFARTGGEDVDLFMRLRVTGGRFARAASAVIHETYPPSRVTLQWALARAYRSGNTDMRVILRYRRDLTDLVWEAAKITAALILSPIAFVLFIWSPGRRVDALRKLWRAAGKLTALQGSRYYEYETIHGR